MNQKFFKMKGKKEDPRSHEYGVLHRALKLSNEATSDTWFRLSSLLFPDGPTSDDRHETELYNGWSFVQKLKSQQPSNSLSIDSAADDAVVGHEIYDAGDCVLQECTSRTTARLWV